MILNYQLTRTEYLESHYAHRTRIAKSRLLFRNLYMVGALCAAVATWLLLSGTQWIAILVYSLALVLILERSWLWRLRAGKSSQRAVHPETPIELTIDSDSLAWSTSFGRGERRWPDVISCYETRNLILLQISGEDVLAIPKRAFAVGEYSRFRELLGKELIVRIARERSDALVLKFVVSWGLCALVVMSLGVGYVHNFLTGLPRASFPNVQKRGAGPVKSPPASLEQLRGRGTVYLIPIGPGIFPSTIEASRNEYQKQYNVTINLLPEIPLPQWAENTTRKQYIAEDLVAAVQEAYPKLASDPDTILIGITGADMYISELDWSYAFSFRDEERFAVISTAHLSEDEDGKPQGADVLEKRLRKVLARDLGVLYFRLQSSRDSSSILYQFVDDPSELDDLGDEYLESDALVRADLHVRQGDPCFILRHYVHPEHAHPESGAVRNCSGWYKETDLETVQIDLRYGLLMDQRTDFLIKDRIPLELTRVLRTQDDRSRAFGVGGNHNLNIFLVGDRWPYTWIDLILEHGGRSHFQRSNWGFGYLDARYQNRDQNRGEFSYSTIQWAWPGWQLKKGVDTYRFPDSGNAQRPEQAALIAVERSGGDRLVLVRDREGNLLRAISPSHHELTFKYDAAGRIKTAQEQTQANDKFAYDYDQTGHLARVTDPNGQVTEYGYDAVGRLNSIKRQGSMLCAFEFESGDRVRRETLGDGRVYDFIYRTGKDGKVVGVDIRDSAGPVRRIRISGVEYSLDTLGSYPR